MADDKQTPLTPEAEALAAENAALKKKLEVAERMAKGLPAKVEGTYKYAGKTYQFKDGSAVTRLFLDGAKGSGIKIASETLLRAASKKKLTKLDLELLEKSGAAKFILDENGDVTDYAKRTMDALCKMGYSLLVAIPTKKK